MVPTTKGRRGGREKKAVQAALVRGLLLGLSRVIVSTVGLLSPHLGFGARDSVLEVGDPRLELALASMRPLERPDPRLEEPLGLARLPGVLHDDAASSAPLKRPHHLPLSASLPSLQWSRRESDCWPQDGEQLD